MSRELIVLSGAVALAGAIVVLAQLQAVDRPEIIIAALISVIGTVATVSSGWLLFRARETVTGQRSVEKEETRRRRILIALRAEVYETVKAHAAQYGPRQAGDVLEALISEVSASEPPASGMPKAVVVRELVVFESVKHEIADLPPDVIPPVLRFYITDEFATQTLADISEGKFDSLTRDRRTAMLRKLFELGREALTDGIIAFRAIDRELTENELGDAEMGTWIEDLSASMDEVSDDDDRGVKHE